MRQVPSYMAGDGSLHSTASEAVATELQVIFNSISEDGIINIRDLAERMTENPLRADVLKILNQLT